MSRFRSKPARPAVSSARPRSRWRRFADAILIVAILGISVLVTARLDRVETRTAIGVAVVNDGDTITIAGIRIRLRGIDAPEYGQVCNKDGSEYRCGQRARTALVDLIAGRTVDCKGWERDRYGRLLGNCMAGPVDLNRMLVREGWAVAYGDYDGEERAARDSRSGLWAGEFVTPRQWRERHGGMVEGTHDMLGAIINGLREMFRFL